MTKDDLELIGGNAELAEICNCSRSTVSMWWSRSDNNHAKIPYRHARIIEKTPIAVKYGWTLEYIMGDLYD